MNIVEYVKASKQIPVCPIGAQGDLFDFLCIGRLTIAEALGFRIEQATDHLWIVAPGQAEGDTLPDTREKWPEDPRILGELENLRAMKRESGVPFHGGGCFGPLTVASDILGAEKLLRLIVKEPGTVERLLEYVTEYLVYLASREAEEGQDLFWIAEPFASLLAPPRVWRFSAQYLRRIYEAAGAPAILHVCGKTDRHTKELVRSGASILSIDYLSDIGGTLRDAGEDVIVMGNISPMTLREGTRADVETEVRQVLDVYGSDPNFILGTGCCLMGGTPDENVRALFDLAAQYRRA